MRNKSRSTLYVVITIFISFSAVLGYIGFIEFYQINSLAKPSQLSILYQTLQLYTLESGFIESGKIPLSLELARWTAPLTLITAIFEFIASSTKKQRKFIKSTFSKNHIIVIGLSEKAINIANNLSKNNDQVICIDKNPEKLNEKKNRNFTIIDDDIFNHRIINKLSLKKCKMIFIDLSDDNLTLEAVTKVSNYLNQYGIKDKLISYHIKDSYKGEIFVRYGDIKNSAVKYIPFNLYNVGGRILFNEKGPHNYLLLDGQEAMDITIFGFSELALQYLYYLISNAYFNPELNCKFNIYYDSIYDEERVQIFKSNYPNYNFFGNVNFIGKHLKYLNHSNLDSDFPDLQKSDLCYIMTGDDHINLESYFFLKTYNISKRPPILCLLERKRSSRMAEENISQSNINNIFNIQNINILDYINGNYDSLAKEKHKQYMNFYLNEGEELYSREGLRPWDQITLERKASNRSLIDHAFIKKKIIETKLGTLLNDKIIDQLDNHKELLEYLIRIEHQRWVGDAVLNNWKYNEIRNDDLKEHPAICSYQDLKSKELQYFKDNTLNSLRLVI